MDLGRAIRMGIYGAIAVSIAAIVAVSITAYLAQDQGYEYPAWIPIVVVLVAPFVGFLQGFILSTRQQMAERAPPVLRAAFAVILIVIIIAVNGIGILVAQDQLDAYEDRQECDDASLAETGNGTLTATLPRSTALHPLLANDASAESASANTFLFTVLHMVPTWNGPALDITLSVRSNGQWYHGGTYEAVASGSLLEFDFSSADHDAIRFSLSSPPLDEDATVRLAWTSLDRPSC